MTEMIIGCTVDDYYMECRECQYEPGDVECIKFCKKESSEKRTFETDGISTKQLVELLVSREGVDETIIGTPEETFIISHTNSSDVSYTDGDQVSPARIIVVTD